MHTTAVPSTAPTTGTAPTFDAAPTTGTTPTAGTAPAFDALAAGSATGGRLAPWARRFVPWFIAATMVGITAMVVPFWFGADPELLLAVIPLGSWIPAVAAVVVLFAMRRPVPILRALALRPFSPRRKMLAAVGIVIGALVVVAVGAVAATAATGLVSFRPAPGVAQTALLVLPLVVFTMLSTLGEELGWRGALYSALAPWGWWRASLAVGAVWTVWHLPLLATYVATGSMTWLQGTVTSVNLMLAAVLLGAMRELSGSVWPAVLGHALLNTVLTFATSNFTTSSLDLPAGDQWILAAAGWAVWIVVLVAVLVPLRRTLAPR